MVRYLPLGNGRVLVSFDRDYRLVDFYFSRSQGENHATGHPFRLGLWVDNVFKWVDRSLLKDSDYMDHTMIGLNSYDFEGISFESEDFVDIYENIYARKIKITNTLNRARDLRLFFHQNFNIYGNNIGDTAVYFPDLNALLHYKGRRYFLASTLDGAGKSMDQYAVGVKDFLGMEGTWKDAEDGKLSRNPVAIGSVDSVVRHSIPLEPWQKKDLFYYIICARDLEETKSMHSSLSYDTLSRMETRTGNYWRLWGAKTSLKLPEDLYGLYRRSLFILRSHLNELGGIMASSDSDILKSNRDGYYYVWPRDAAMAAYALIKADHQGPARKFFDFSKSVISPDGYFYHKYLPDGKVASSWLPRTMNGNNILPIQEDETSLVVWALWKHFSKINDIEHIVEFYEPIIRKAAKFIMDFTEPDGLPKSSFDLWEERYGVHAFTVVTAYAALKAAENFATTFGDDEYAREYDEAAGIMKTQFDRVFYSPEKGYYARAIIDGKPDFTVDSAIMSTFLYDMKEPNDPKVVSSMKVLMDRLWVKTSGGLARYENDNYQRVKGDSSIPGNPWIITTLWAAQYFIRMGDIQRANDLMQWVVSHKQQSGIFPEQVNPYDGTPLSVSPLVWSHAQYIITAIELEQALRK